MTVSCHRANACAEGRRGAAWIFLAAGFLWPAAASAQPAEPRVPAGKCVSDPGTLLTRAGAGLPWKSASAVFTRDPLLALAGLKAVVEPAPNTVQLTLWGNLPQQSPYPVLESAAVLHDSKTYDLDVTLLGGRAVFSNAKKAGAVRVWLRMPGEGWEIALNEAGTEVAVEVFSRWPRGVPFTKDPLSPERPTSVVGVLVLKGQADLKVAGQQHHLSAPPGPAYFHWDSIAGADAGPQRREKAPLWANPGQGEAPPELKIVDAVTAEYREGLRDKAPDAVLLGMLAAAAKEADKERAVVTEEFAILGLAAMGELAELAKALASSPSPQARTTAITALRHWIGSAPGRDLQLYRMLIDASGYSERQAETVLQMLHSAFDPNLPETYETLIDYLQHDKQSIRELARWHLCRLVPEGIKIRYDAAASAEERVRAAKAWKELIPTGELPKKTKDGEKKSK